VPFGVTSRAQEKEDVVNRTVSISHRDAFFQRNHETHALFEISAVDVWYCDAVAQLHWEAVALCSECFERFRFGEFID